MALPALTGWDVHVRSFPPLHAEWDPRVGAGTLPALLVGGLAVWWSVDLAQRLPWRTLLLATYGGGLAWLFSLALVDGKAGVGRILDTEYEYLRTARATTDLPATLREYVSRIPFDGLADDIESANWPPHVAGHPPGALSLLRAAHPDRSGERPRRRHRDHADRGLHGRGSPGHPAVAGGGAGRPTGGAFSRLRPGGNLAGRQCRRDVRRRRSLGYRGARGRSDPS